MPLEVTVVVAVTRVVEVWPFAIARKRLRLRSRTNVVIGDCVAIMVFGVEERKLSHPISPLAAGCEVVVVAGNQQSFTTAGRTLSDIACWGYATYRSQIKAY